MIAYIGWGSLIWDTRDLPIAGEWQSDGPDVRVEYQRQSLDGRLTLVLCPGAQLVRSLWARFEGTEVLVAQNALAAREGISAKYAAKYVGVWHRDEISPESLPGLADWAEEKLVTAVLWTALPPKFDGRTVESVSIDEALSYLSALSGRERSVAEEYVRRTPEQIATHYRKRIQEQLGWNAH